MAEALFKSILNENGVLSNWQVASAGTWADTGIQATNLARQVMRERSLDIEGHRSQPISGELLAESDLVLVMEERHREYLQRSFPLVGDRVHLFSEIAGYETDIDDPVTGTLETYRATVDQMAAFFVEGFDRILEWVVKRS
jgi:protein-tyrosine-phosphatase